MPEFEGRRWLRAWPAGGCPPLQDGTPAAQPPVTTAPASAKSQTSSPFEKTGIPDPFTSKLIPNGRRWVRK